MKKQHLYSSVLGILLSVYIGIMAILNIFTSDKVFSESENRRLEQAPKFSMSQIVDGRFTSNYEKYISDQFPFRDFWIGVKSTSERLLGKRENNEVYLSRDGYLMEKFKKPDMEVISSKIHDINLLGQNLLDIDKYFMLVPNSVKILEDKLPYYAPNGDELVYINKIRDSIHNSINFIDIYDVLYAHRDEYIFYKTDHHWTTRGAYLAYKSLMDCMDIPSHNEDYFDIKRVADDFYGSLYSKSGFRNIKPDTIELYIPKENEELRVEYVDEKRVVDSIYNLENLKKKDKYTVFLDGNYPLIKIKTNINTKDRLLIIKDSYANSMVPFLTGHFHEIYIVDPRYYDKDIDELMRDREINKLLILYNAKTFFSN